MNATLSMSDLLERAGFNLRSKNRADCVHCSGSSIATVSFTDELAFCHRCHWTMNIVALAKALGVFASDAKTRQERRDEAKRLEEYEATIARFEAWRDGHISRLSAKLRALSRTAITATQVLSVYRDCDEAWDALARYCHAEGELHQLLDFLCCTKASKWLNEDTTLLELFDLWRREIDEQR